ncbi:MAG: hypothetical protein GX214_01740 [Clostridiales bacterium]|nr:hypothetical protein [Clostridiales bacterium]
MDIKNKYNNLIKIIKPYYKIADGFSLKFIPMFLIVSILTKIILKVILHKESTSRLAALIIIIIAILVSLLWTDLVLKSNFSIFDRPLTKYLKKQALSLRGTAIVIFYLILRALASTETSGDIVIVFSKKLVEFIFAICIIVLIISFIIIAFRKTKRPIKDRR